MTVIPGATREQREQYIADGLAHHLGRWINTMARTGNLKVIWADSGPAPAWTDCKDSIWLNRAYFDLTDPACVEDVFTGVLHELGHVLNSPSTDGVLSRQVRDVMLSDRVKYGQIHKAFNLLEDCRNETIFSVKWPSTKVWFTNSTVRVVLGGKITEESWAYVAGREFMPVDVLSLAYSEWHDPSTADELRALTLEYNRLRNPGGGDRSRALAIITRFTELLPVAFKGGCGGSEGQENHGGHGQPNNEPMGDPEDFAPGEDDEPGDDTSSRGDESDEDGDEAWGDDESGGDTDGETDGETEDGEGGDGEGDGEGDSDTDGDGGDSEDGEGEGDSEGGDSEGGQGGGDDSATSNEPKDGEGDSGNGAGYGDKQEKTPEEILEDILDQTRKSDEFKDAEEAYKNAEEAGIKDGTGLPKVDKSNSVYSQKATDEHRLAAKKIADLMREITSRVRPGWKNRLKTGQFDVPSYVAQSQRPIRVFKKYNPGMMRAVDIHVEVLVDQSGSMSYHGNNALKAIQMAHTIKVACDKIGATCAVHMFGSDQETLYDPTEKADPSTVPWYSDGGGTEIGPCLWEAVRNCTARKATVKLVFILTDGAYTDLQARSQELHDVMEAISKTGARSHLFVLSPYAYTEAQVERERQDRFTDTAHAIQHVDSMIEYFRTTLIKDMKKVLKQA